MNSLLLYLQELLRVAWKRTEGGAWGQGGIWGQGGAWGQGSERAGSRARGRLTEAGPGACPARPLSLPSYLARGSLRPLDALGYGGREARGAEVFADWFVHSSFRKFSPPTVPQAQGRCARSRDAGFPDAVSKELPVRGPEKLLPPAKRLGILAAVVPGLPHSLLT